MAKQKRTDLLFVADTAAEATSAETVYDAAEDSCILIAHRANARSDALSPTDLKKEDVNVTGQTKV